MLSTKKYLGLRLFCLALFLGATIASTGCRTMDQFFGHGNAAAGSGGFASAPCAGGGGSGST